MRQTNRRSLITRLCRFCFAVPALGVTLLCGSAAAATDSAVPTTGAVTIDFNDVDIQVFINFIGELTQHNFIVDPRVKAKITIFSPGKLTVAQAYQVFEAVLEVHGYTVVPAGRYKKVVPAARARTQGVDTLTDASAPRAGDRLVTRIVSLDYADPNAVRALLAPLVSKTSVVSVDSRTRSLIVTDVASNIHRLLTLIKEVDVVDAGRQISVIPLRNAAVSDVVATLNSIHSGAAAPPPRIGSASPAIFVGDERTNTLIVLSDQAMTAGIREIVNLLERRRPSQSAGSRVYRLHYADAEETAGILREFPRMQTTHPGDQATLALLSEKIRVHADKATNSVIVHAPPDAFATIESIIGKLDIARAMVYIEVLVMEASGRRQMEIGAEWIAAGKGSLSGETAAVGGGFVSPPEESALPGLAEGRLPEGFSVGVFSQAIEIGDASFNNLAALVSAVKTDRDLTLVSTPQVLVIDNEEAKLNVGRNIPFQTSTSTTDNETFNSFEYRDVGTILKVTPYIGAKRQVRLDVDLEISVLESTTDFRPTTIKRTVEASVLVEEKTTIVIGGLVEDSQAVSETKVPLLGDIPGLGWLFKSRRQSREKTHIYVFLTPRILRDPSDTDEVLPAADGRIGPAG